MASPYSSAPDEPVIAGIGRGVTLGLQGQLHRICDATSRRAPPATTPNGDLTDSIVPSDGEPSDNTCAGLAGGEESMTILIILLILLAIVLVGFALSVRILKQYERGVQFRLGRVRGGPRGPGLVLIIPLIDRLHRVSLRIVTMPIQSQGIITRDNVSVDVSAVAYFRVEDVVRSVVAIENVSSAINQIAQTTLRAVVGRHTLDETLSETETINRNIREILDVQTEEWGVKVTVVELKDIQLPESMKRAMARQAEAEREKRAKIIAAQGEALAAGELASASDVMMAHPLALQLRNLQTLAEIAVDRNSTVVFPAPLMSTIQELGAFLNRETTAAATAAASAPPSENGELART
jgi:regulator of protease activity HflC (stomatin/prohibitin superfamily)